MPLFDYFFPYQVRHPIQGTKAVFMRGNRPHDYTIRNGVVATSDPPCSRGVKLL